jgi:hypothetical protein
MDTAALFWGGKVKLDSRMVVRRAGGAGGQLRAWCKEECDSLKQVEGTRASR